MSAARPVDGVSAAARQHVGREAPPICYEEVVADGDVRLPCRVSAGSSSGLRGAAAVPLVEVKLYLVQHGQAKAEDEDPERPLTTDGADAVARVARRAVERLGVRRRQLLHSGKTRARQTAEIWGRMLDVDGQQSDALAPNDDATVWVGRIAGENEDLMLVGHLPHLARLATLLVTDAADPPIIQFQPGGLVALERSDAGWVVGIVLPPQGA